MKIVSKILTFAALSFAGTLNAQNTIPDSLFGVNSSLVVSTIGGETGGVFLLQPDGLVVYGGTDYDITINAFHINLMRFDECGTFDSTFGLNGTVRYKFDQRNTGNDFALQPDGKIVCAGVQAPSNAGSQQRACVSRFNSDGSPDSTFNLTGSHPIMIAAGNFGSVHVMNDGRILGIGFFGSGLGAGAARFMPDGTLDTTFNGDGIAHFNPNGGYFAAAKGHLLSNGKIIITAYSTNSASENHFHAIQLDSTGALDTTYGNGGSYYDALLPVTPFSVNVASSIDGNGNLVMSGSLDNTNVGVLRLNPAGVPDGTFGTGGQLQFSFNGRVNGMDIMSDGNILLPGRSNTGLYGIGCAFVLLPDGAVDTTFGPNGFRLFDLNNNSGSHNLDALLELPNGQWIASAASDGFLFKKYGDVSNVPHITEFGGVLSATGTGSYQWFLNSQPIPNATQNTFTPVQNGDYTVIITDANGCTGESTVFVLTNVGIEDALTDVLQMSVYPNPSAGLFYFDGVDKKNEIFNIEVTNTLGGTVFISDEFMSEQVLDITHTAPGVYFVKISTGSRVKIFKVSKY